MCYNLQALGESLGTGDDVKDMDVIEKVMRVSRAKWEQLCNCVILIRIVLVTG